MPDFERDDPVVIHYAVPNSDGTASLLALQIGAFTMPDVPPGSLLLSQTEYYNAQVKINSGKVMKIVGGTLVFNDPVIPTEVQKQAAMPSVEEQLNLLYNDFDTKPAFATLKAVSSWYQARKAVEDSF